MMGERLMNKVERWACLSLASAVCAVATSWTAFPCVSQSNPTQHKKTAPKKEPTSAELFAYIRGALLEFSGDDGANDNLEVSIDPTATVLTIKQPDGHCDIFLNALDANTMTWDVYDASDSMQTRAPLARMTVNSVAGKKARTCYDLDNNIDPALAKPFGKLLRNRFPRERLSMPVFENVNRAKLLAPMKHERRHSAAAARLLDRSAYVELPAQHFALKISERIAEMRQSRGVESFSWFAANAIEREMTFGGWVP